MTADTNELSLLGLSRDEISKLPSAIRRKIAAAFDPTEELSGDWLLVGARQAWLLPILTSTMRSLPRLASARRDELSEQNIRQLVDILLGDIPRAEVDADIEMDNAEIRAAYLRETKLLSGAAVRAASSLAPKNKSEPASRWKREGKIFAIRRGGADLYPAFQFADGSPHSSIKVILEALPENLTAWQIALWFASGNGWLDGAAPQDCLNRLDEVATAARQLANLAIG